MKLFLTIILIATSLHVFGQVGYFVSSSDYKSNKLVEMDSFVEYKNSKAIFMKNDEKVKVKKNDFFVIQDKEGYHYRIQALKNLLAKLHVKNNICVWGNGVDSKLTSEGENYTIKSNYIFVSKNLTSELYILEYGSNKDALKLIKSDNKLFDVVSRIKKTNLYPSLMLFIIDTFNKRKPMKKGSFEK